MIDGEVRVLSWVRQVEMSNSIEETVTVRAFEDGSGVEVFYEWPGRRDKVSMGAYRVELVRSLAKALLEACDAMDARRGA